MTYTRLEQFKLYTHFAAFPKIVILYIFSGLCFWSAAVGAQDLPKENSSGAPSILSPTQKATTLTNKVRRPLMLSTKEQQLKALDEMLNAIEYNYAGLEGKQELFGLSLPKLKEKYEKMINDAITVDEFYNIVPKVQREVLSPQDARYLLVALSSEFHDGHFSLVTQAMGATTVGLKTVAVGGRLYVSGINKSYIQIDHEERPAQERDEIIKLDMRSIDFYKNRNLHFVGNGTIEARIDEALERILEVPAALLPAVPHKNDVVKITFRRGEEEFTNTYKWVDLDAIELTRPVSPSRAKREEAPFLYDAPLIFGAKGAVRSPFFEGLENSIKMSRSKTSTNSNSSSNPNSEMVFIDVGTSLNFERTAKLKTLSSQFSVSTVYNPRQTAISPAEHNQLLELLEMNGPVKRIRAYMVGTPEKPVAAVLRIPSYFPHGGMLEVYKEISFIEEAIEVFKQPGGPDVLIIDQVSNPGGYTQYAHMLLSLLTPTDTPMIGLRGRLLLNESLLNTYLNSTKENKDLRAQEDLRAQTEELRRQYESGERMSAPLAYGLDQTIDFTKPNALITSDSTGVSWDKKIIILADSRSASCAEIVPAILQDNNGLYNNSKDINNLRVIVLGEKTMGLGNPLIGHMGKLNYSETVMRCPYAVCTRANGEYIENIGVAPDVDRALTVDDWSKGFTAYFDDVINVAQLFSQGKSLKDIKLFLNKNSQERAVGVENKFSENSLENILAKLKSNLSGLSDDIGANSDNFKKIYADFFEGLYRLESENLMSQSDWDNLIVPLPKELINGDILLRTSQRKDVLLQRLEQIQALPHYKQKPLVLAFIKSLHKQINKIQGHFNYSLANHNSASACGLILSD